MNVREQYERHPYPPVPWIALPRRGEGERLVLPDGPARPRILVAGCGTFEPLVVAQANPSAARIDAIDISAASIRRLRRRMRWMRAARPWQRLPRVRSLVSDLMEWNGGPYDYVLASNVLHHLTDPAAALAHLSRLLRPGGRLRVVTYPRTSRIWMRETARRLREAGLRPDSPNLVRRAAEVVRGLPESDPVRSCFESQPETRTRAGLVDAFFNALENPLTPLEWRDAAGAAGLELTAEDQTESSRSGFLTELLPETAGLDAWTRLQILDDVLELCANPVLWLRKTGDALKVTESRSPPQRHWKDELRDSMERADGLLQTCGSSLDALMEKLRAEVGPRVGPPPGHRPLPGLSVLDHWKELMRPTGCRPASTKAP